MVIRNAHRQASTPLENKILKIWAFISLTMCLGREGVKQEWGGVWGDGPLFRGSLGRQHSPQGLGGLCRKMGGWTRLGASQWGRSLICWWSTVRLQLGTAWPDPKPKEDVSYRGPRSGTLARIPLCPTRTTSMPPGISWRCHHHHYYYYFSLSQDSSCLRFGKSPTGLNCII